MACRVKDPHLAWACSSLLAPPAGMRCVWACALRLRSARPRMHVSLISSTAVAPAACQADLIQAAQEERARSLKLKKASKQQAAHAAAQLLQAPSGFSGFANRHLQVRLVGLVIC